MHIQTAHGSLQTEKSDIYDLKRAPFSNGYSGRREMGTTPKQKEMNTVKIKKQGVRMIAHAGLAGLKVNCYTVDRPENAEELVEYGVDFITTNIPE
jgi:glycerophosphoryl diester phosphodiesterase